MENYIPRDEHNEFCKRMEEEHKRINHRLSTLEETTRQINDLIISVKEMAISMKSMLEEQKDQGKRLEALESRDGEMWRKIIGYIATVVIGAVIGYMFKQIGM